MNGPAPIFEQATSPLYSSNDGTLWIDPERNVGGFTVSDRRDDHVELFTKRREIADAFVAGYDYATRKETP